MIFIKLLLGIRHSVSTLHVLTPPVLTLTLLGGYFYNPYDTRARACCDLLERRNEIMYAKYKVRGIINIW